jgi:hypothetical protein
VRRAQGSLGRLAGDARLLRSSLGRKTGLLGLVGAACVLVTHASAEPAPAVFRLTVAGTEDEEWTYSAAPVEGDTCTQTKTSYGIRTVSFRTTRPTLVRLLGRKVGARDVGPLAGIVTLVGANTTEEVCGGTTTQRVADCARTRRAFRGATVGISSPRPGKLDLRVARNLGLSRSTCPLEPREVLRRPLGPALGGLTLPRAALMTPRVIRITLHGTARRRTKYRLPEKGELRERVRWTLTFARVSS